MTDDEIRDAAWGHLIDGAEARAEDWIDEDGAYTSDDAHAVFRTQMALVRALRLRAVERPWVEVSRA